MEATDKVFGEDGDNNSVTSLGMNISVLLVVVAEYIV